MIQSVNSWIYYHFRAIVNSKLFFHVVTRLKHSSLSSQTVAFWSANMSNFDSSAYFSHIFFPIVLWLHSHLSSCFHIFYFPQSFYVFWGDKTKKGIKTGLTCDWHKVDLWLEFHFKWERKLWLNGEFVLQADFWWRLPIWMVFKDHFTRLWGLNCHRLKCIWQIFFYLLD